MNVCMYVCMYVCIGLCIFVEDTRPQRRSRSLIYIYTALVRPKYIMQEDMDPLGAKPARSENAGTEWAAGEAALASMFSSVRCCFGGWLPPRYGCWDLTRTTQPHTALLTSPQESS